MLFADVVESHSNGGFFASPSGIVTLALLSTLAGAFAMFMVHTVPQLFSVIDDVKELLKPSDQRKIGLVDRLTAIESNATIQVERMDNHLMVSAGDLRSIRDDIAEVRGMIMNRSNSNGS